MKNRFATAMIWILLVTGALGKDWKCDWNEIHHEDEAKWAQVSGLSASAVHTLWRMASHFADENDDDSRIDDLHLLPAQKHIILVTSWMDGCLAVSAFQQLSADSFRKLWTEDQTPDGQGFCATRFGKADVGVFQDGSIHVNIPMAPNHHSSVSFNVYEYGWINGSYRFVGKTQTQGTSTAVNARQ